MTDIRFTQRLPAQGTVHHSPTDTVTITRGQRTTEEDGTVLLPGRIVVPLVYGVGEGNIEPTKPGEHVVLTYNHRDSYIRRVSIPASASLVLDTDLPDIVLD